MEYRKVIFVGGIHGVGKSTFANQISKKYNIPCYSSSDLISRLKGEIFTGKCTEDIGSNQDLLIEAVNKTFTDKKVYMLDGHFCLLNNNKQISRVPIETYKDIGIDYIIVLIDKETNIYDRLKERDDIEYNIELIESFQKEEIEYAKKVAMELKIPIKFINITLDRKNTEIKEIINEI